MGLILMAGLLFGCSEPADSVATALPEPTGMGFPIADRALIFQVTGMDHDGVDEGDSLANQVSCTAYDGAPFPDCYGGHRGNDYLLEGGFETMDGGSTEVLAAAAGTVTRTHDGEYDRCRLDVDTMGITCDGFQMKANFVIIEHETGLTTRYWHLKTDSVSVAVGDEVACGDVLGLVGSSGNSSMPHLHFEVRRDDDALDPYAGEFSQETSLWRAQDAGDGLPVGCD